MCVFSFGVTSIIVWALGIPLSLLYMVYTKRHVIRYVPTLDDFDAQMVRAKSASMHSIGTSASYTYAHMLVHCSFLQDSGIR